MKGRRLSRLRPPQMGILAKTALLSWLVTIITMALFVAVILPSQKRTFLENLESKAHGVSVSLQDIAASSVVTEDYSVVVDHCLEVLAGDETIEHLVLTRNDGFGLIHTQDGWRSEQMGGHWYPRSRITTYGISRPDFLDTDVFLYSRPFDYSGIEYGWIHVGLSLDAYRANVKASYARTAWLAVFCISMGLVASVFYAKRIVTPILQLRQAAQRVADGDLSSRARVESGDEVEALARAFNSMTQAVQDREARVRAQNLQLAALVTEKALHSGDIIEAARRITEASAETLGVERVGVWLYNDDQSALECLDQFNLSDKTHSQGATLTRYGHEKYFTTLEDTRVIAASDAETDPQTSCLTDSYLHPSNISSLLHAAIRIGGRVAGVVCHEHVRERRDWTLEEENFAGSIAVLLALALEARDRSAAQDELLAAKEAAEAASEAKSQFLANMSHEIRTPINGVMGMLQLLEKNDLPDRQKRYVTSALNSAGTLLTVIGDVLDFSKIEAGHFELDHCDFAFREALDSAVRLFAGKAESQGIELSYVVAPEVPDEVVGDSSRFQQVLINLVGNAVKFTNEGEVHVDVRLAERTGKDAVIRISVRDTGLGIHPNQRQTIFKSFAQGDASMRRHHGGTGLGLAISRHLVTLMDGEIGVESEPGKGSTFTFTARLELQENVSPRPTERSVGTRGLRVLVVDDSDTARQVICQHARTWSCNVGEAANASDALSELKRAAAAGTPYEFVLIDNHMPGIDGFRLSELLGEDEVFQSLRLILLSGLSVPSEDRLRKSGFAGVVSKPVRASDLYDTIVTVANGPLQPSPSTHDSEEIESDAAPGSARILLVEDNEINREVAREMIEMLGHTCESLPTGAKALDAVASGRYDLVLMDCQMPGVDGYEATEQIREWETKRESRVHIPIIALTAHAMKGDRDRCLLAGMDDYLSKPLQAAELAEALARWLSAELAQAPPETEAARAKPKLDAADMVGSVLLEAAVVKRCGGNRTLAARLLRQFVVQTTEDLTTLGQAADGGDAGHLVKAAHRLKGAAGNLGLRESELAAAELEEAARSGKIDVAYRLVATLQTEAKKVAEMAIQMQETAEEIT